MSREIKFRAWNKINNTMHPFINSIENWSFSFLNQDVFIWMQFTGLHDKNNNPIYEGDLGKVHHGDPFAPEVIVEVIFKDGAFGIMPLKSEIDIFGNKYSGGMLPFYDGYKPDNFEVIGNIYESPLIKIT